MFKVGIIDDEKIYLDKIKMILSNHFSNLTIKTYDTVNKIEDDLDFILLDIEMPDIDGIDFAKNNRQIKVIFVTNHDLRFKEAFGTNIYGFVSKSNLELEIIAAINDIIEQLSDYKSLKLMINNRETKILLQDIIYLQYISNRVISVIYQNKNIQVKNITLKKIFEQLDDRFIQISRETIINKKKIKSIHDNYLRLKGVNTNFYISRRRIKEVKEYYYGAGFYG